MPYFLTMKPRPLLPIIFMVVFCHLASAQISDDFSDGNYSIDPSWYGDTSEFVVEEGQLRLMALDPGSSFIYLPFHSSSPQYISIDFSLPFAPSGNNKLRIYPYLDRPDPQQASGICIELGESGSTDKVRVSLLQDGEVSSVLASSSQSYGINPYLKWIVSRDLSEFSLAIQDLQSNTIEYLNGLDIKFPEGEVFFGIECTYSETRKDKFYFDNLVVDTASMFRDSFPPQLIDIEVADRSNVFLYFDEPLAMAPTLQDVDVSPAEVPIRDIQLLMDSSILQVLFASTLPDGEYLIRLDDVADRSGNLASIEARFLMEGVGVPITAGDVIISEIFDDPTPVVGLPGAEYIELFAHKGGINLSQLQLQVRDKAVDLPPHITHEEEYILLYDDRDSVLFSSFPQAIGVSNMPTLINAGSALALLTDNDVIVDWVHYSDTWFADTEKSQGGWALERMDLNKPCALKNNWAASIDIAGGTPGMPNSISAELSSSMNITTTTVVDMLTLEISFDFRLALSQPDVISGSVEVSSIATVGDNHEKLQIALRDDLQSGHTYTFYIKDLASCGNALFLDSFTIVLPEVPETGDVVINEILFNPVPGGVDFVEIVNVSRKYIRLSDLFIANKNNDQYERLPSEAIFSPDEYLVLCRDPSQLRMQHNVTFPEKMLQMKIPAFNNDAGHATLYIQVDGQDRVVDEVAYAENWHHPLLREKEGVSLEKVNPRWPGSTNTSWQSASQTSGFATPTAVNSQFLSEDPMQRWVLESDVFSPDGDGYQDILTFRYMQAVGRLGQIRIFDTNGRMVHHLINNVLLDTEGEIFWDGILHSGAEASVGVYIALIETFDVQGQVYRQKIAFTLARPLE